MACQVTLSKAQWDELLSFFELPIGMTSQQATLSRQAVTTLYDRQDLKESYLYVQKPAHRLCLNRYWEDGVLLPFGASRDDFIVTNPADPLKGWSFDKILDLDAGPATNDIYGKLHVHVRQRLRLFREWLQTEPLKFTFSCMDARDLHSNLPEGSFDRIEASNISDDSYIGMRATAKALGPLLRHPNDNPNATLITLFMNAVASVAKQVDGNPGVQLAKIKRASEYLRMTWVLEEHDPELHKVKWAAEFVRPKDAFFDRTMDWR
ncbi:hypothetical protein PRZ48_009080 [Zasmidium cellare]|uniref:Uncharacterized protein n=1 Tax=Zasmidium cellare TaxID=395010 RepID=A0ABR0EIH4_ZASCE|nr:hypothetical protein PRZ48_009080 [Zasmidium cellare]